MTVIFIVLALWVAGWALKVPPLLRLAVIATLWAAVMLVHLTLPEGAGLRAQIGGDANTWGAVGVVAAGFLAYRAALGALRRRAQKPMHTAKDAPPAQGPFAAGELPRYARHILLREIGGAGQARLKTARVLVVGAGGLGSPALMYLAAAGVGTIAVIDDDLVDQSNLSRQIIHAQDRVGLPKVQSAQIAMAQINPFVTVLPYARKLDAASQSLIAEADLVLDGSDNMATRYLVNAACVAAGKPLISAALNQWEGQVSLYHPAAHAPCYACIFPHAPDPDLAPPCAQAGVVSPLPGVIGAIMALEAVKHLSGAGSTLAGRLLIYDALDARTQHITLARNPACPVCSTA
jgi:molybdopterin/thiamine biosynthesis adenylyltransferase